MFETTVLGLRCGRGVVTPAALSVEPPFVLRTQHHDLPQASLSGGDHGHAAPEKTGFDRQRHSPVRPHDADDYCTWAHGMDGQRKADGLGAGPAFGLAEINADVQETKGAGWIASRR
jgi:hypothetical protein